MVFKLKMNLLSTGGMDSGEQHLLVTPSPTTVSSIDPKLLLIQSPKENDTADTNGSEQPLSSLPAPVDSETPALAMEPGQLSMEPNQLMEPAILLCASVLKPDFNLTETDFLCQSFSLDSTDIS